MIGRQYQNESVACLLAGNMSRRCHRGTGVAARRFEYDLGFGADFLELFADQEAIVALRHDQGLFEQHRVRDPLHRILQGR